MFSNPLVKINTELNLSAIPNAQQYFKIRHCSCMISLYKNTIFTLIERDKWLVIQLVKFLK